MSDMAYDSETAEATDIGDAIEDAANAVFGDGSAPEATADGASIPDEQDGSSPGAIEQIGGAVREALEYAHDVEDEPPTRSAPYAAGGPS